jgi:hypothetical protein
MKATMYWHRAGDHAHVAVFCNGARCGELCFRWTEWNELSARFEGAGFNLIERKGRYDG